MIPCYLHVDLDAFFASVEQLDNPEYKGKAVIVGGLPSDKRSVVSTCSYEARKYGVHSAMPTAKAYKLCPNGIYLRGRMERYHEKSREVMKIFYDFSPDVKQMSVDEAFIDISGTEKLFGSPKDLAIKLKKEVFEKTGLTVSVGIASNKYIAKIASGLNKPNGLCYVENGQEENFMLNLPLSKLWGAGTKTQEKLKSFGFYTTKQIHTSPLSTLVTLFGNCTGTFLYNAVRGKEVETFTSETKSHSISAEETYSYDLQDIFTIETALLKLCYEVRFRLLDEGWHTKTLHIKIRYEDFSTVSVQNTFQRPINSLDEMYEKICTLFKSKYDFNKGIRLLGVGAFNLEKGITSSAKELFDFGDEKQRKIEEAVLKVNKKNPKTEIKKARQLIKKGFLTLLLCFSFLSNNKIFSENINNHDIEFYAEGSWETTLKETIVFNFQKEATGLELLPLVFNQKAALSCFFMYKNQWYFDAVFQDGFENNNFIAGYKNNFDNGIFTDIKVGNKNIDFTTDYGTSKVGIGFSGESKVDFGISALVEKNFENHQALKSEFIFRIDNFETFSKTWTGEYQFETKEISLTSFIKNQYFTLPFDYSYFSDGKIYTKNSENNFEEIFNYLVYPIDYKITFENPLKNITAITIKNKAQLKSDLLKYIKNLKNWFTNISLQDFLTFLGFEDLNINSIEELTENHLEIFFTKIENQDALIIFNPGFFSLFENKNIFPVNIFSVENVQIISKSAEKPIKNLQIAYSVTQEENLQISYNFENQNDIEPINKFIKNLFPLGEQVPLIYFLPTSTSDKNLDFVLSLESTKIKTSYNIGTKALPGSVTAYINGILTPCTYEQETGNIIFVTKPMPEDKVQIFWKEYTKENLNPNIFTALGFMFNFNPYFGIKSSISYKSPILLDLHNQSEQATFGLDTNFQQSTLATVSVDYQKNIENVDIKLANTTSFEHINYNITNKYTIFSSQNLATTQKAYFSFDSILEGNGKVQQIDNSKYQLITKLEKNSEENRLIFHLPGNSNLIFEAEGFYLQGKISDLNIFDDYNLFLEIGDFELNPEANCARWKIEPSDFENSQQFSTIYIPLSMVDKTKIGSGKTGKIIFEKKDASQESNYSGEFTIRSFEYVQSGFIPESGVFVKNQVFFGELAEEIQISDLEKNQEKSIRKYIAPVNLNNYKDFAFSLYIPNATQNGKVEVALLTYDEKKIFSTIIDISTISKNQWEEITINLKEYYEENFPTILEFTFINPTTEKIDLTLYLKDVFLKNAKSEGIFSDNLDFSLAYKDLFFLKTQVFGNYISNLKKNNFSGNLVNDIKINFENFTFGNQVVINFGNYQKKNFDFIRGTHFFETKNIIFNIFNFSENFVYNQNEKSIFKTNTFGLDFSTFEKFPAKITFTSNIKENSSLINSENLTTSLNFKKYNLIFDLNLNQVAKNVENQLYTENYFSAYGKSIYYQLLNEKIDSSERKETFKITQEVKTNFLSLSPKLSFFGENLYFKNGENLLLQNLGYDISLPFYVNGQNFSAKYGEKASSIFPNNSLENSLQPTNFHEDLQIFLCNSTNYKLLIPGFTSTSNLINLLKESENQSGLNKSYNVGFSWKRNIFANYLDLIIPSSVTIDFGKSFKTSNINVLQSKNFSTKILFTAFNIFGKDSSLELFNWYNQDEIIGSFSVNLKNNQWDFSFYNGINLYFAETSFLSQTFEIKNTVNTNFSIYESIGWNRNSKNAYLVPIIRIFNEDFCPIKITRFDSFSFSFANKTKESSYSMLFDFNHHVFVYVTENTSINTMISSSYSKDVRQISTFQDVIQKLEFAVGISAKLSF